MWLIYPALADTLADFGSLVVPFAMVLRDRGCSGVGIPIIDSSLEI